MGSFKEEGKPGEKARVGITLEYFCKEKGDPQVTGAMSSSGKVWRGWGGGKKPLKRNRHEKVGMFGSGDAES